jgi:signal transduction histidine kinase
VLFAATLIACCSQLVQLTRHALTSRVSTGVAVREALAGRLRDRTLAIAYWLPERELFVDERGHVVELPSGDSGRAWTAVEHGGRRVAAIIHDAELEDRPELVEAAAAGAVLALGNEQLKADLRARLVELRASRRRIVEASIDTRKRLERDLHDGAQQQLVSLSVDLQLLQTRITDAPTLELLETSRAKLAEALADLRELARGIHPAVLTARGLAPALEALAQRAPLPVELTVDLSKRPPASVESAAYFLVSEALTNVAKYAEASAARVFVAEAGGLLTVQIEDDGIGGADPSRGSGLRGLSDRIAALDGRLEIESAAGAGTRISATIPLKQTTTGPPTRHESSE